VVSAIAFFLVLLIGNLIRNGMAMFPVTLDLAICTSACQEAVLLSLRDQYKCMLKPIRRNVTTDFVYLVGKGEVSV
jgi:hypothetical protein